MLKTTKAKQAVEIITPDLAITGQLFTPLGGALVDLFNQKDRPFLPMSDATLYPQQGGRRQPNPIGTVSFLVLRREHCLVVLSDQPLPPALPGQTTLRQVFMLDDFLLEGSIAVPTGSRLSDVLGRTHTFFPAAQVKLYGGVRLPIDAQDHPLAAFASAVVNLAAVLAITEAVGGMVSPR
ncbi:MAG: hypothetical protein KGZ60_00855 [Truepera sp.]|nr:hypothetical protein [Truepera sp.]